MTKRELCEAVRRNLEWFRKSGVMDPADGSWGVAERLAISEGNAAFEKIVRSFPAWKEFDGYCVIEPRRPDCNFQTALLFLLAGKVLQDAEATKTGENLLFYLYRRSGMAFPESGVWNWSNISKTPSRWFDDNGWCGALQLRIAALRPDLDAKYRMTEQALRLARLLAGGVHRSIDTGREICHGAWPDPEGFWAGEPRQPHWGSVALLAGTAALRHEPDPLLSLQLREYYEFLERRTDALNASELCYALLGAACAAKATADGFYTGLTAAFAATLLKRLDPETGNLPAEHCEAPTGANLVDLIYTANWALLGLQAAAETTGDRATAEAYRKLLALIVSIQDQSDHPAFRGCWRGMYDLRAGNWGGGDCYEGGQNSIYSGWTNAPVALALLFEAEGKSLASF